MSICSLINKKYHEAEKDATVNGISPMKWLHQMQLLLCTGIAAIQCMEHGLPSQPRVGSGAAKIGPTPFSDRRS